MGSSMELKMRASLSALGLNDEHLNNDETKDVLDEVYDHAEETPINTEEVDNVKIDLKDNSMELDMQASLSTLGLNEYHLKEMSEIFQRSFLKDMDAKEVELIRREEEISGKELDVKMRELLVS